MEQSELSYIVDKDGNWYNFLGKLFAISSKPESVHTLRPCNPTPRSTYSAQMSLMETKRHEQEWS